MTLAIELLGISEQEGRLLMTWSVRRFGVSESGSRDDPQIIAIRERVQRICAEAESEAGLVAQGSNDAD